MWILHLRRLESPRGISQIIEAKVKIVKVREGFDLSFQRTACFPLPSACMHPLWAASITAKKFTCAFSYWGFPVRNGFPAIGAGGKEPTCQCRRQRCEFDPGLGRSFGGVHGSPLQYSCLENPMDRGAWWATVLRVARSQKWLSTHAHSLTDPTFIPQILP